MKLWPWKNLEKKMKCGPSICGMDGIQIRQRRTCVPQGTQKNVYGFLHTRSSDGRQAVIFNVAGRALRARPRLIRLG